ncbi:unnamed protein product [Phytophthora fragariaefolia]|uniref:Unnamed protein product n=1 Tax=Phytophthora fragariaefolia TaxID=1490495 RepID=A0A9W6Y2Q6_9STRA|nr:unnamed protein product [Phytophthora fragariaefolia]
MKHLSASPQNVRTKFGVAHKDSVTADSVSQQINSPDADMFTASEADASTLVPVFDRQSCVGDICVGGKTQDECRTNCWVVLKNVELASASPRAFSRSHEWNSCPTTSHGTV